MKEFDLNFLHPSLCRNVVEFVIKPYCLEDCGICKRPAFLADRKTCDECEMYTLFMGSIKHHHLFNENIDRLKRFTIEPKDMASWANKYLVEKMPKLTIELRWFIRHLIIYYLDKNEVRSSNPNLYLY